MLFVHALVIAALAHAAAGDRLFIQLGGAGRGLIAVTLPVLLGMGVVALPSFLSRAARSRMGLAWLVYWAAGCLLPLAGILWLAFPPHTAFAAAQPLLGLAVAAAACASAERVRDLLPRYFKVAVAGQTLVASAQYLGRVGYTGTLVESVRDWDATATSVYGYEVLSRSLGMLVNPNALGLWAALSFWIAATVLRKTARPMAMMGCLLTLVLSQSRGGLLALSAGAIPMLIKAVATGRTSKAAVVRASLGLSILGLTGVAVVLFPGIAEESFSVRVRSGANVLVGGIDADANLRGRTEFWSEALASLEKHPFGTLGPPQLRVGVPMDSDYIAHLVQGGLVYFLVFATSLLLALRWRGPERETLSALAAVMMVAALTQPSTGYAPMVLFWLFVGLALARVAVPQGRLSGRDAVTECDVSFVSVDGRGAGCAGACNGDR